MVNVTAQEIDKSIAQEALAFNSKTYDGLPLPDDIMEKFRQGVMVVGFGEGNPHFYKELIGKPIEDLNWMEVGFVVNYVKRVPLDRLFDTLEEAVDYHVRLSEVQAAYNEVTVQLEKQLNQKRQMKYKLAGLKLSVPFQSN